MNIAITGIGLTSGLGDGADVHVEKISAGQHALRPLAGLFGDDFKQAGLNASWIENRKLMLSRKWAPASTLAVHCAKQAVADAGLVRCGEEKVGHHGSKPFLHVQTLRVSLSITSRISCLRLVCGAEFHLWDRLAGFAESKLRARI